MNSKETAANRFPFSSASSSSAPLRLCVNLLSLLLFASPLLAQQASVTQLTSDVYLFRFGFHSNIFVVTAEGVIATDPISPQAAPLYLREIRKVTDQPVRYVIYSHDHTDHIGGGSVFQPDGARFVAHQSALPVIRGRGVQAIVPPDLLVGDEHELRLGGKLVRLMHLGRIESESNIAIYLPQDKVLMWVDAVRSYGVPYRYLEGTDLRHFRRALQKVEKLDIDHLVHGHGPSTDKSQVTLFRRYFDDLDRFTRQEMKKYPVSEHRRTSGQRDPHLFFDTYIQRIASRSHARMRSGYSQLGGFESWGSKNAERMVVFFLHELPFE